MQINVDILNAVHKLEEIKSGRDSIITATISNNLNYIVFGGVFRILKIWDYQTNTRVRQIKLKQVIKICKFTDDSKLLYVGTANAFHLFVVQNNFKLIFKQLILGDFITNIYCISNTLLLTSSFRGVIAKVTTNRIQSVFQIQAPYFYISGLDYNRNHNIISSGSYDGSIQLWNGNDGSLIIDKQNAHKDQKIEQVFVTNDNQLISLVYGECIIWNIDYKEKQLEHFKVINDSIFNISLVQNQYIITVGQRCIKIYTIDGNYIRQFDYDQEDMLDWSYNITQLHTMKAVLIKGCSKKFYRNYQYSLWVCKFQ